MHFVIFTPTHITKLPIYPEIVKHPSGKNYHVGFIFEILLMKNNINMNIL